MCMMVCVVYCRNCWRRLGSCSRWITRAVCGSSLCVWWCVLCIVRVVGGGSGHVLGGSPVLCVDPRSVYDGVCCVL